MNRLYLTRRKWISNAKELVGILKEFFCKHSSYLGIITNNSLLINTENENDSIEKAMAKYKKKKN